MHSTRPPLRGTLLLVPIFLGACSLTDDVRREVARTSTTGAGASAFSRSGNGSSAPPLPGGGDGKASLEDCVVYALENNFQIRMARASEKAAVAEVSRQKGRFDPVLGGSLVSSRQNGQGWGGVTGSGGLTKRFLTGTEVSVEAGDVYRRTGDFRDDYLDQSTSDLTVSLRQPLLRGAGWKFNRSGIRLAELLKEQATAEKTAEVLQMLRAAESAYWAAAVAADLAERQQRGQQRAEKLHSDVKAKLTAGEASQLDILEADVALAGTQERLVAAKRAAADRLDDLWFVLGVPVNQRKSALTFRDSTQQALSLPAPDPEGSTVRALRQSPSAVLLVNEVQRRELEVSRARNGLLPQVDLELNAERVQDTTTSSTGKTSTTPSTTSSTGTGSTASTASTASAAKKVTTSGYDAVALLKVSMPLTFRTERAELAKAKAELERSQASRDQAELRLRQRIAELCRALTTGKESLRVARVALNAYQKKLDEQMKRHAEGLVSTHDLRLSQEELDAAEARELQARLQLLSDQAALGQLDGTLANRHGISL